MAEQTGALDLEAIEERAASRRLWLVGASTPACVAVDLADWRALIAEVRRLRAALVEDNEAATSRIWVAETERDQAQAECERLRAIVQQGERLQGEANGDEGPNQSDV